MKKPTFRKDTLIVGFTLFATFFGAGNLVFPPYMGIHVGDKWFAALIGLFLTGILLSVTSTVGVVRGGGSMRELTKPLTKYFYIGYNFLTMYGIATFILVPRTAATTHEVGVQTLLPGVPRIVTSIVFFAIVYFLTVDENGVVDKIGKYLTPVLLGIIGIIIVKGIVTPVGEMAESMTTSPLSWGFTEGYQMGDLVTGLLFSTILISTIKRKGYSESEGYKLTYGASAIALLLLTVVYGSLLYIGSTASSILPRDMERTTLLTTIVQMILGDAGSIGLAIAITLACLTTATGLLSSVASFTQEITEGRISYKMTVAALCIFCIFQGSRNVENIIVLSAPFFNIAYPLGIILTIYGIFKKWVPNEGILKGAIWPTTVFTICYALFDAGFEGLRNIVSLVPLGLEGFGWLPIAIAGAVVGGVIEAVLAKDGVEEKL